MPNTVSFDEKGATHVKSIIKAFTVLASLYWILKNIKSKTLFDNKLRLETIRLKSFLCSKAILYEKQFSLSSISQLLNETNLEAIPDLPRDIVKYSIEQQKELKIQFREFVLLSSELIAFDGSTDNIVNLYLKIALKSGRPPKLKKLKNRSGNTISLEQWSNYLQNFYFKCSLINECNKLLKRYVVGKNATCYKRIIRTTLFYMARDIVSTFVNLEINGNIRYEDEEERIIHKTMIYDSEKTFSISQNHQQSEFLNNEFDMKLTALKNQNNIISEENEINKLDSINTTEPIICTLEFSQLYSLFHLLGKEGYLGKYSEAEIAVHFKNNKGEMFIQYDESIPFKKIMWLDKDEAFCYLFRDLINSGVLSKAYKKGYSKIINSHFQNNNDKEFKNPPQLAKSFEIYEDRIEILNLLIEKAFLK